MESASANASHLVVLLCLSVLLLLFHILLQGFLATRELGSAWNAGPRDEPLMPKTAAAGRAARASKNYQETYPAFIGSCSVSPLSVILPGLASVAGGSG